MRTLCFDVKGQKLTRAPDSDFSGLVRGTAGYLHAKFSTDSEWNGCKKAAAFCDMTGKEFAAPVINGVCEIPKEALAGEVFSVCLAGMRAGYKITTNKLYIEQGG